MRWISSSGGPLVFIPQVAMNEWRGALGEGVDYELACAIESYAGLVRWNSMDILVLGDEPLQTAARITPDRLIFIRWMYAPDEDSILRCPDPDKLGVPVEAIRWVVRGGAHVLFDAGVEGSSAQEKIEVPLDTGIYRVATHVVKPRRDVGAVVHDITRE